MRPGSGSHTLAFSIPGRVVDRQTIVSDANTFPTITNPRLQDDMLADLTVTLLRPSLWPPGTGSCAHAQDALDFKARYLDNVPTYDWTDFWGPSNGQIQYK